MFLPSEYHLAAICVLFSFSSLSPSYDVLIYYLTFFQILKPAEKKNKGFGMGGEYYMPAGYSITSISTAEGSGVARFDRRYSEESYQRLSIGIGLRSGRRIGF